MMIEPCGGVRDPAEHKPLLGAGLRIGRLKAEEGGFCGGGSAPSAPPPPKGFGWSELGRRAIG